MRLSPATTGSLRTRPMPQDGHLRRVDDGCAKVVAFAGTQPPPYAPTVPNPETALKIGANQIELSFREAIVLRGLPPEDFMMKKVWLSGLVGALMVGVIGTAVAATDEDMTGSSSAAGSATKAQSTAPAQHKGKATHKKKKHHAAAKKAPAKAMGSESPTKPATPAQPE